MQTIQNRRRLSLIHNVYQPRIALTAPSSMDANHFPSRLHEMLCTVDQSDDQLNQVVSWQPHGRCFLIKQKHEFIDKIIPRYVCSRFFERDMQVMQWRAFRNAHCYRLFGMYV